MSPDYSKRFQWMDVAINCINSTLSSSQLQRSILCAGSGLDSDCSGGAKSFETAMKYFQVSWMLRSWPPGITVDLLPRSTCEADKHMRRMGGQLLPGTTCQFIDVLDIYSDPEARSLIDQAETYEDKLEMSWTLRRSLTGRCVSHHSWCPLKTGATCKMSGWPCQDHSQIGLGHGLSGQHLPVSLAVGARADYCRQALNAVECTVKMPRHLPSDAFGSSFTDWQFELLDPPLVGFDMVSRPRLLICPKFQFHLACESFFPKWVSARLGSFNTITHSIS